MIKYINYSKMSACVFSKNTNQKPLDEYEKLSGEKLPKDLSNSLLNSPHSGNTINFVLNGVWYEYKLNDKKLSEYYLVSDENGNLYHKKGDLKSSYQIFRIPNTTTTN